MATNIFDKAWGVVKDDHRIQWQYDEEHMDWYEDGHCPKCKENWNIDSHAWHCPTCGSKLIERDND